MEIPVYLFTGFLEAGKTKFIQETLQDKRFNKGEHTTLILCEEGVEEYDPTLFSGKNVHLHIVEEEQWLTPDRLSALQKRDNSERVIVEYNGVWGMKTLYETPMPYIWRMVTQFTVIDSNTFEVYFSNMKSMFADMLRMSEKVYMNRCTRDDNFKFFKDSIKACAPHADILSMSDEEGPLDIMLEEDLPYDLNDEIIKLNKESYMIWYVDMLDYPERYEGKVVEFSAEASMPKYCREGYFVAGNRL